MPLQWVKAITLTDPWAMLTFMEEKRFETRDWWTGYRGYVVIHAAKTLPPYARDFYADPRVIAALQGRRAKDRHAGCGLCVVRFLACIRTRDMDKLDMIPELEGFKPARWEMAFGDYSEGIKNKGRYATAMLMVKKFERPIPANGALGLWKWPWQIDLPALQGE